MSAIWGDSFIKSQKHFIDKRSMKLCDDKQTYSRRKIALSDIISAEKIFGGQNFWHHSRFYALLSAEILSDKVCQHRKDRTVWFGQKFNTTSTFSYAKNFNSKSQKLSQSAPSQNLIHKVWNNFGLIGLSSRMKQRSRFTLPMLATNSC